MGRSDKELDRQLRRIDRRLERLRRKGARSARVERLETRRARVQALRELPPEQRPAVLRLSPQVVQTALAAASLVLAATPAGPVLKGLDLGSRALGRVRRAVASQDGGGVVDGLAAVVREELAARGVTLSEDDEAFDELLDALEDQLEPV